MEDTKETQEEIVEQEPTQESNEALGFTKALPLKGAEYKIDREKRTVTQYISTKTEDRGRDIMMPKGMVKDAYDKNPIVLWQHDRYGLPVGKALWTKAVSDGVISQSQFAKHEFADDLFNLVVDGFINATSIGYKVIKQKEEATGEVRNIWGMDVPIMRTIVEKWELLEYSYVNIPMNPEALVNRDFSALGIKSLQMKSFLLQEAEKLESETMTEEIKQEFEAAFNQFKTEIQDTVKSLITESLTPLNTNHDAIQKQLMEIAGEFKTIKDARAKEAAKQYAKEIAAGVISKASGKVDHLLIK